MKILKYILLLILVVVIGLAIYTTMQPGEYEFTKTRIVQAPVEVVFEQVDDYRKWEEWGPWNEDDPTLSITYEERTKGPGSSYTWSSKEGDGKATRVESVPHKSQADELDFGSMGTSTAFWKFEPSEDGTTSVTWGMRASRVPYMMKFFSAISGGYENMMAPMFERGLERLDSLAQVRAKEYAEMANAWSLGEVSVKTGGAQKFVGYAHSSKIDAEAMQKIYMESMPMAGEYALKNGLEYGEFVPGAIFTKWDEEAGETDFMVGIFLNKGKALNAGAGMQSMILPAGNRVTVSKFGNYGTGDDEAHEAVNAYIQDHQLTVNGPIYEMYVNDPTTVQPNEIETDIFYPVK